MSALSNESFSHYRCVEATLPFSAIAQQFYIIFVGKVAKAHERNFHECPFE